MAIDVLRDKEGLRMAILELFEEGYAVSRIQPSLTSASEESRDLLMETLPVRKLSPGYYKLAEYMLETEEQLRSGVPMATVAAFEAVGITVVVQCRGEFERRHPACPACGTYQDGPFVLDCHKCGHEFHKRKK